jgi:hypothetical protein
LLENGADPGLADTFYKTPLQIALLQAFINRDYTKTRLGKIYTMLISDSLHVQVDGRLIKIDPYKVEFLAVHLFLAVQSAVQQSKNNWQAIGVQVNDFITMLQDFPEEVVPFHRKKRQYWLAILAKHETEGKNPYNKKLFERVERGVYVLNSELQIRYKDNWISADEIINGHGISVEDIQVHASEKRAKEIAEWKRKFEKVQLKRAREEMMRQQREGLYRK